MMLACRKIVVWRVGGVLLGVAALGACGESPVTAPEDVAVDPSTLVARNLTVDLDAPLNYAAPAYPAHYDLLIRSRNNTPASNPVTDAGATLGRVLFHDPALSLNRTVTCASCHVQEQGFTDPRRLSRGFQGGETGAHSMRLGNAAYYTGREMFWDRRADDLEEQSLQPVLDPTEMGFTAEVGGVGALLQRLEGLEYYPPLFAWAFGSPEITEARVRQALSQYVRSIVSVGSRFDDGFARVFRTGGPVPGLTAEENEGFRLFRSPPADGGAGCAGCHEIPTFALDANSGSNGLDAGETRIFKAPSLKNVAVTGPYMHDGRFATLEEVVDHYDAGVRAGPALDRRLRGPDGSPIRLNLSSENQAAWVAFMRTLTDTGLLSDPRFGDPFIR